MSNFQDTKANTSKILVTKGNLATFTKDAQLRTIFGDKSKLAMANGRFVAVNLETGVAVDNTNIGSAKKINLGVRSGNDIRWIFDNAKGISPKALSGLSVSPPKCPTNPIYDAFFKCASCDKTYVMKVEVLDQSSRSAMADVDNGEGFTVSHKPNCGGCEPNCDDSTTCASIAPEMVSKFNLIFQNTSELKVIATPIYAYDSQWCFPADADGVLTDPITEFSFGDVTVDSLAINSISDLEMLVYEINKAFTDNNVSGTATLIGIDQYGKSCSPYILVNTAADDFAIKDYVASTTGLPLTGHSGYCGMRFIATLPSYDCDCMINVVANFTGRFLKIYAIDGFEDLVVTNTQTMELPENFGAQVMWMEHDQEIGGEGRTYAYDTNYIENGTMLYREPISRLSNAIKNAMCEKDYYLFELNFDTSHIMDEGFHNMKDGLSPNGYIAVPKDDSVTLASVQSVINAIATASGVATINYASGTVTDHFKGEN